VIFQKFTPTPRRSAPAAAPYAHQADSPASLHDVTSGSNGSCGTSIMCKGAVGYDGPTGVGTPKGITAFAAGAVDTTPPQTTITSSPSSPTNDSTPTFAFSSSEPGSTFECQVDGEGFGSCSSPYTSTALADGSHTFEVRATNAAANTDSTPASTTFTVDTQAPVITLVTPAGASLTGSATPALSGIAGTASGDSSTVNVKIYAGTGTGGTLLQTRSATRDPSTGAYSVNATTLGSGTYTAQASQSDSAGNTGLSAARTFTVDTTAPTSQASSPANTNSTTIPISYTASDAGGAGLASVELWVKTPSGAAYTEVEADNSPGASGSFSYNAVAGDGIYGFYTRAVDSLGNYEAAPASADSSTVVDTTAQPDIPPPDTTPPDIAPAQTTNDSQAIPTLQVVPPTAVFSFEKVGHDERGNSVTLTVDVPGPGTLVLFGRKVQKVRKKAVGAGPITLTVRPKRRFGSPPRDLGKAKVNVSYTPLGGAPATKATWVTFRSGRGRPG